MASGQDEQELLEKLVDDSLRSCRYQRLDQFLEEDPSQRTAIKCSKQFLFKVDKLVNRCLDRKDAKHASLCLTILYKCGKKLSFPGGLGPSGIIAQGIVKKMVDWFEKCRQLWIQGGPQRDEALLNLAEDFFDSLMAVHEISKEATYQVTDIFLHPIGQLAAHPTVYILIKKEAIRKLNMVLDKMPEELKKEKKIFSSQEASDVMTKLAGQILEGGDYDFQTALMEALCRMATPAQRRAMVHRWFSMDYVAKAFIAIRDSEFETDCRTFLNLVNGMQGDNRRVYSYPCLEAFLDKHELLMPSDEQLEEFWIDFNLGSQSLSFYFALADEEAKEGQWDTICITESEVHSYAIREEATCHVLRLRLCEVVCVGEVEGTCLTVRFSPALDILHAVRAVYGHSKNKGFVGKSSTSVVKTTIKILMEDSCSQPAVPESQVSLPTDTRDGNVEPSWLAPPAVPVQLITPARRRVSESSTFINGSAGASVHDSSPYPVVLPANTPGRVRGKPALQMVRSGERPGPYHPGESNAATRTPSSHRTTPSVRTENQRNQTEHLVTPSERSIQKVKGAQEEDLELLENSYVPDSQPVTKSRGSTFSNRHKHSVTDMLMMPIQRNKRPSRPESEASTGRQLEPPPSAERALGSDTELLSHKRLHLELSQRLQEVINQISLDSEGEEPAGLRGKRPSAHRGGPQMEREPAARCPTSIGATAVAPPPRRADTPGLANRKRQGQSAPEPEVAKETSAARKAVPAKVLQDRTLNPKVTSAGTVSGKEKKDAELADSMVKLISSRYNSTTASTSKAPSAERPVVTSDRPPLSWAPPSFNKSIFERSWLPSTQKDARKATGFNKSYCNPMKHSTGSRGDIFVFRDDGSSHIGGKPSESSALESSSSMLGPRSLSSKKAPLEPKAKRYVTKHLFSDTDTDHTRTDVSWLRDSSRKPKPKVTDYTRKAPAKTTARAPDSTYESPDLPLPSPKRDNVRPIQKRPPVKAAGERPEMQSAVPSRAAPAAGRRPQRAAATHGKSYRDPDTDDSLSEMEQPPAAKKHPSVEQQAKREQASEVAERKKRTSLPFKPTNQKVERHGRDSHPDKEFPAPSKKCTTGRRVQSVETDVIKPSEAKRTSSAFTKQLPKTYQGSHIQSEVDPSPGPQKQAGERAFQGGGETQRGGPGLRPNEQMSVQKASWTSRSPYPPAVEKMRSATTMTPAPAISPLTPLLSPLGSLRPTRPDAPHHLAGRGGPREPAPITPRPVAAGKGGVPPGGPRKRGSALALPLRFLPPHPHSETPVGRPAAQRGLGKGCVSELSPIRRPLLSVPRSPLSLCSQASQPMLTSTALDADKSPAPCPPSLSLAPGDGPHDHGFHYGSSKESSVYCPTLSSVRSSMGVFKVEVNTSTILEKTPSSTRKQKPFPQHHHVSGPSHRDAPSSPNSSSDEEEQMLKKKGKRARQRSPKMKPRKLFKSSTKVQADSQISEDQCSSEEEEEEKSPGFKSGLKDYQAAIKSKSWSKTTHNAALKVSVQGVAGPTRVSREWAAEVDDEDKENEDPSDEDQDDEDRDDEDQEDQEDEDPDDQEDHDPRHNVGDVCQTFSSKLQKKLQNRYRRMERYGRQSAQTALRHVTDIGVQVNKYRTQHLEQVRQVLHEEITHLEQDSTLKHMEKELNVYWRKQSKAFHSYREKENSRHQRLKDTLQNNKTYSLDHEGKIFTSQMYLMRKDMKCVQDRLFKEMQEEELHSVRRGLRALFMPETALF